MRSAMCLAILFLLTVAVNAQQGLTLEESVAIALQRNYGVQKSHERILGAEATLEAARDNFKSHADLSLETPTFYEAVTEQFDWATQLPRWIQEGSTRYLGRLNITQPLPTSGTLSLSSILYRRRLYTNLSGVEEKRSE